MNDLPPDDGELRVAGFCLGALLIGLACWAVVILCK